MKKLRFFVCLFAAISLIFILVSCPVVVNVDLPEEDVLGTNVRIEYTDGSGGYGAYAYFGAYPQSLKASSISIDKTATKQMGEFTYYKGSDGYWYLEIIDKYYKVEPIKWRVFEDDDGELLLLAENILTNCAYFNSHNSRTIFGAEISENNYEHSRIRAFLNGLAYNVKIALNNTENYIVNREFFNKGFLQTAFTEKAQDKIITTAVVNNARSTNPDSNASLWNSGANQYASADATNDKVFLLSEQEITKSNYGFADYNAGGSGNSRIRRVTDYASVRVSNSADNSSIWWLRSPDSSNSSKVRIVGEDGNASYSLTVSMGLCGLVPAIRVSSQDLEGLGGTSYTILSGVDGSAGANGVYVLFGDWPQTIKAESVVVDESIFKIVGNFTYYLGSNGAWYVRQQEKAYDINYSYSDGTAVAQSNANSFKYFKVEPIKWRVVTTNYNGSGKKLLLAENILIDSKYDDDYSERTIGGNTIYPNNYEHSRVRAFLNGLSYETSDGMNSDYNDKGFLQTAFTSDLQNRIATTTVVNDVVSTNPDGSPDWWNDGENQYASVTPTSDKIFLLSEQEVTMASYGFAAYNTADDARVRKPTDFALASGANIHGYWWLRSTYYEGSCAVNTIDNEGAACMIGYSGDGCDCYGVVPALCIDN